MVGALFGVEQEPKTRDAMILQDRDVHIRDQRVRQENQSVVARGDPRSTLDGAELQGIEPLAVQRYDLERSVTPTRMRTSGSRS